MPRKHVTGARAARTPDKIKITVDLRIAGKKCQRAKTFTKATSTPAQWEAWREEQRGKYGTPPASALFHAGSLGDLAHQYLQKPAVRKMPSFNQREAHIWAWVEALGRDRTPASVTGPACDAVLELWAETPTNQWAPGGGGRRGRPSAPSGLAPETLKKRRSAFRALFSTMYGKGGFNPVKASACPKTPATPDERGIPIADARRIVDAMPAWAWPSKGVRVPAFHKIVARIILETGWPPKNIGMLERPDLVGLTATPPTVRVGRRIKGGGVEARLLPVGPGAVVALRDFAALDRFGPISEGPTNVAVKHAAAKVGVALPRNWHAYDLRHAFGTALALNGETEATIGYLMLHAATSTQARRYTAAARALLAAGAVAKLAAPSAPESVPVPVPKTARKTARASNQLLLNQLRLVR